MIKVAINSCYGGFALSKEAVRRLAELGDKNAQEELETDYYKEESKENWYNYYISQNIEDRINPLLIQVIEELREKAYGDCTKLKIIEINRDIEDINNLYIEDYDGWEKIHEEHQTWS